MSKPKSEFIPYDVRGTDGREQPFAYEFVPSTKSPRAVYLVFDGERVAELDVDATGKFVWVPLVDGFEVKFVPGLDQAVAFFDDDDERLH